MHLTADLAEWINKRPAWQKDVFGRLCTNGRLTDQEIESLTDAVVTGTYSEVADIAESQIPGSTEAGDPVLLEELSEVRGVNALLPDQTLSFGDNGLTIVFGFNGSGKSGYARIIRQGVTARVRTDVLLGNVFEDSPMAQAASLRFKTGSSRKTWALGDSRDHELSRVRFFDEDCGEAYVSTASAISYHPSALNVLDELSHVLEAVSREIGQRIDASDRAAFSGPTLRTGTAAHSFRESLTAATTDHELEVATRLSPSHGEALAKVLAEEARLKGSDPAKEKTRLRTIAGQWAAISSHASELEQLVSEGGLSSLRRKLEHARQLREAAAVASARSFDGEPLENVGSDTWRALWEAARAYSTHEAYPTHEFPHTRHDARCVLCQQELSQNAAERLTRFEQFIADTTAKDADTASEQLATLRSNFEDLAALPVGIATAIEKVATEDESSPEVKGWFHTAVEAAAAAVAWVDGDREDLPKPISSALSAKAKQHELDLKAKADLLDTTVFESNLADIVSEVAELEDQKSLNEASDALRAEIERLRRRANLEAARRVTATNALTTKRGELIDKYVTAEVRDRFTRETEMLQLRRVTLNRTGRTRSDALQHKPSLLGVPAKTAINEVLSEGEQTALGLAGFLTEVQFDDSRSAVILDDPVSSLDAIRRSAVAKRLIAVASERQVVVFTHEITFAHALVREAESQSVRVTMRSVQKVGDSDPGLITTDLPWTLRDIPQRVHKLEEEVSRVARQRSTLTEEQYAREASAIASLLSETLERAVHLHLVNELVDRGTNQVRPRMLKILPRFTQEDHDQFQASYSKLSGWAARHDNAPEENYTPPTTDELLAEIGQFKIWFSRVKRYTE